MDRAIRYGDRATYGQARRHHIMPRDQPIAMERMPQQCGLLGAEDDWTGVTSSAARRKVQNRVNQRAYRRRKQFQAKSSDPHSPPELSQSRSQTSRRVSNDESSSLSPGETELVERDAPQKALWTLYRSPTSRSGLDRQKLSRVATICKPGPHEQEKLIAEFERWVERCQRLGSPRADHLLVLVKFSVFRAFISNGADLGYTAGPGVDDDDARSPFTDPSNVAWHARSVPAALQPTRLQRRIPHHPWIDILPCPVMRDNLLLAVDDTYDDMELCADLVGSFCKGSSSKDEAKTGLIVWGEPWDIAGWEVTESFVQNWGWIIHGCEQLLRATKHWRERRGEGPIQVERILCEQEG